MKRLILLVALVMAMAVLAPVAFANDLEEADAEMEEKEPSTAQELKAQMIARYFAESQDKGASSIDLEYVWGLRTGEVHDVGHTVGWGVVYKLLLYVGAEATKLGDGDGWGIGHLRKAYLEDSDNSEMPKSNLGQLHREQKSAKPAKTMPDQAGKKDKTDS